MTQRCGFCAIIGAPNAGKSTLVNALVGSKVAIVSPKVQTTRMPVRGIAMAGETQIIFVDTPGIFRPRRRLDRAMVTSAWAGAEEADAVLLIVDATDLSERAPAARDTMAILEGLKGEVGGQANRTPSAEGAKAGRKGRKTALVLNKIDGMKRTDLLPLVEKFHAAGIFEDVFLISALKGEAVADVATWVAARMPEGPWLYPEDQAADIPSRLLAAEVTREKIYLRLHDELPYASAVETEKWEERKDGSVRIDQIVYVQREGQKAIVLGKGGATIKKIGELARTELEELFGRRVHLFLFVKVREDWAENSEHYREIGLDYPTD
jgi:GTP-binding protein Era